MSKPNNLHPDVDIKEYEAFEQLLKLITVQEPGAKTSFDAIGSRIGKFLFSSEKNKGSMIRSDGVWYFPFGDKRFALDRDQLNNVSAHAESTVRMLIGDYLYSYARKHAELESRGQFFIENMRFDIEFDGPKELESTIYFKISLFHPYKPQQRPVPITRGD